MKAVLCKEFGPPETLVVEDIASPEPGPGQVVLDVHAAAVNFPDTLIIENKYQFKPPLPFAPGGEVAGVVSKLGEGASMYKIGDRVIGSCGHGGFVEELAIPETSCVPVPDSMDLETASALVLTYGTSYYALKDRAYIKPGENLLVMGAAGGVGLAAVELGKAMGARVIAAASSQDKLDVCTEHGADETLLYPSGEMGRDEQRAFSEAIKELTGGQGADVVYDPVGGDYAEPALRATNWDGRYLVIGFAAETEALEKNAQAKRMRKGCDWLLANDVSAKTGIMGGDENAILCIEQAGVDQWPRASKAQVAERLVQKIIDHIERASTAHG